MGALSIENLRVWYQQHYSEILDGYFTFLRFPSISTDPAHRHDVEKTADWLGDYLNKIGFEVEKWPSPGLPVVFAEYTKAGPDRPTLLIYHHYDVQPVDPLEEWKTAPFEPAMRDNQVYARGAVDNKGQCFYSLTALRASLELARNLDLNIKVFIEGEEECGGAGTAVVLQEKKHRLKADYLLVVDFGLPGPRKPGIHLGMRGLVTMEVTCQNGVIDLHSGEHGGIALNPNRALATLLAGLWDEKGRVNVPGFYDAVSLLTAAETGQMDMSFDRESYQKDFGVRAFCPEEGFSLRESNGVRPVLEINGMSGGYTGLGVKTVIPARASAKLSCRLVPHQDPITIARLIESALRQRAPEGITLSMTIGAGAPAFRCSMSSSLIRTVASAYQEVFGSACQYLFCGASVPIVGLLAEVSGAQVAMMGMGLPTDDIHAPNEHFGMDRFELGFLTMGKIISGLAEH